MADQVRLGCDSAGTPRGLANPCPCSLRQNGWPFAGAAAVLLLFHTGLLAWSAYRQSPTVDELAHLPAGISHWQFGNFDLYHVNPPLVRMVAALPVLLVQPETNWRYFSPNPYQRPEFAVGHDFVSANGPRSFWLFTLARWACIPFSLLGALVCFFWARQLYGYRAGLLALALWCFCPTILAHGQLITPDVGGTALAAAACYAFWGWLRQRGWFLGLLAALTLGLALLAKTTCLLLFFLWPLIWLAWVLPQRPALTARAWLRQAGQLAGIFVLALILFNAGYGFEGSFRKLADYQFTSRLLTGDHEHTEPYLGDARDGNRFAGTWLAEVPVPLPRNFVQGIDVQSRDFEGGRLSYLRGDFRHGGWWYYYLYALAVKVPLGTLLLFPLAAVLTISRSTPIGWRNELVLVLPFLGILAFVSSQTGLNHHLRYVLPIFPFAFIWVSRLASAGGRIISLLTAALLAWAAASSLYIYPHSLSYFNELAGGPRGGPAHLLDSNIDWGQDLLYLKSWLDEHPEARPLRLAYFGLFDPCVADPRVTPGPKGPDALELKPSLRGPRPGWYAVSVNLLYGYRLGGVQDVPDSRYTYFRRFTPVAMAGYSIYVYHITPGEANRVRLDLGLPELPERTKGLPDR